MIGVQLNGLGTIKCHQEVTPVTALGGSQG